MDPLSLTFGVAGLVSLAQVVVKAGYNYIRTAKDAREDISNLISEVAGISGVLEGLKSLVDDLGKACDSPGITKLQQVSDCKDVLQLLGDLLQKINPTTKTKKTSIFRSKSSHLQNSSPTPEDKKTSIIERIKEIIDNTGKIVTWPLSKDETVELMNRLSRHKATFILALSADNTAMLIKVLDGARQTNDHLVGVRSEQDRVAEEKREEDQVAKLCWLFPGDPDKKHRDIRKKRHEGTGGWFFDTEEFKNWLRDPRWLFCHGKAGVGKTVLTSAAIDHIDKIPATDEDVGLAHIYCGFKDREEQIPTKIFASILRQLGFQKSELPSEIESLYKKFTSTGKAPQLDDLVQAITSLAGSFSSVWLFFDALDECDKPTLQDLLPCIQNLMKTGIRGFVTSRSHVLEIRNAFEKAVEMELSARQEDMEIFVRSRLSTRFATELVNEIISRILGKADGIFLLVAFQVGFIMEKKRPKDVRKCLNQLPTGLDGIYENILHKINQGDEDNKKLALNALSWISHATQPFRPKELIEALTIEEDDSAIEDKDLFHEKVLVDVCGGLVMIDENSETVRFVHYTVQEHLGKSLDGGAHVHAMMAKICLTYLSFDAFDECPGSGMDIPWLAKQLEENAFYEYAACNWGYHTKSSEEEKSVVEMICTFSEIGNRTESALHAFLSKDRLTWNSYCKLDSSRNTLSVAAIIGLPQLAESLVLLGNLEVDLKDKNSDSRTALSRAAEYGHLTVVELLVNRDDVEADSKDTRYGRAPLSWAAANGHLAVVELLVNRDDVEADSKDDLWGRTPFSWAAANGHLAVVELLVNRDDVEADSKDTRYGQTPLFWAAANGHRAVVGLLVNRDDVEADSKDTRYGRTPLSWAAANGHLAVVELLVNRDDVEADSKDDIWGQTPLSRAAANGHLAVVELLVNRDDVEVDSKGSRWGQTPLSRAAGNGHLAVVGLLVNRDDVEADSKDSYWGQTPLSWAAENGHLAVVELLVNRDDVEADSKSNNGQTPLSWVALYRHLAVVELLVNRDDVKADSKSNNGQTPLSRAAEYGHLAVVELLLDSTRVKKQESNLS